MKQDNSPEQNCPSPVDLSAWLDGEHSVSLEAHLATCKKCRRVVAFYRCMDQVVRGASQPDGGLPERIICACLEESGRTPVLAMPVLRNSLKLAAAVAVLAGAGFWLLRTQSTRIGAGGNAVAIHAPGSVMPDESPVSPPAPAERKTVVAQQSPGTGSHLGNRLSAASLRMASTQSRYSAPRRRTVIPPRSLQVPGHVSQVWVVSDLEQSSGDFVRTLPEKSRCVDRRNLDGATDFRVVLPDDQLPGLVNSLARKGYALVTPNGPQPETPKQAWRLTHRNVWYDVRLVAGR